MSSSLRYCVLGLLGVTSVIAIGACTKAPLEPLTVMNDGEGTQVAIELDQDGEGCSVTGRIIAVPPSSRTPQRSSVVMFFTDDAASLSGDQFYLQYQNQGRRTAVYYTPAGENYLAGIYDIAAAKWLEHQELDQHRQKRPPDVAPVSTAE